MTDMLDRVRRALNTVHAEHFDPGKMVLHANRMTLDALAREAVHWRWPVDRPSPGTFTKIAGVPVAEDNSLAPSRLVLRYEVEC